MCQLVSIAIGRGPLIRLLLTYLLIVGYISTEKSLTAAPLQVRPMALADSARKLKPASLLSITVRLVDTESDTVVTHGKITVLDEKTGQAIPAVSDSVGFRLAAPPGSYLSIQASAPAFLPAKTRVINLAIAQQLIMKLTHLKPSVLTIKAFSGKINQPLSTAVATITSRTTGKSERLPIKNGRVQRKFTEPDNLDIQVSAPGHKSVGRQLTIDVPPSGKLYELDAELDKLIISLTIRSVDSRTDKSILGGQFTLMGRVGQAPITLVPSPRIGQFTAVLPDMGVYQLTGSAKGYESFTKSLVIHKEKTEEVIRLVARLPNEEPIPDEVETTPAVEVTSVASVSAVKTKSFGLIEKGKSIRLNKIYFDQSSPVLRSESYTELDQLYGVLTQYPSLRIEIHGHTDNQGDFDLNTQLSRDRCQAVIDYLVGKGIRKNRLKAVGRGPLDPVAPNNNEENRKKNRRVEFVVL
ncbi:OmpA family protein [Spirosoma koreense]